jgi:hypothetical protein
MQPRLLDRRPSSSMIVAFMALIVSLGGTGYAAITLPKNSVGAKQIKRNAIRSKHIKRNAVTGSKVRDASLFRNDFAPRQLPAGPQGPPGPPGPTTISHAFGAHSTIAQPTAASQVVSVQFSGEDFDTHGDYSPETSRYRAPVTGYYHFSAQVHTCCNTAVGRVFANLRSNRVEQLARGSDVTSEGIHVSVISAVVRLERGDEAWVQLWTSAGLDSIDSGSNTAFSGFLVAAQG